MTAPGLNHCHVPKQAANMTEDTSFITKKKTKKKTKEIVSLVNMC